MQNAIYNNSREWPPELLAFHYRKLFGLSATEFAQEPADQLFTNLLIEGYLKHKQQLEEKASSGRR